MGYRADASNPYPLVVCCDAPWTFGTAVDTTRILSMSRETPRCVVAGIAHDTADMREMLDLRAIDYTVTPAEAPPMTGIRAPAAETGGAESFRQWLAGDVLPLLRDRYHVGETTYVGSFVHGAVRAPRALQQPGHVCPLPAREPVGVVGLRGHVPPRGRACRGRRRSEGQGVHVDGGERDRRVLARRAGSTISSPPAATATST